MKEPGAGTPLFAPGVRVRVKSNPARTGVLTGDPIEVRGVTRWMVAFLDGSGTESMPELALEPAPSGPSDPYTEIALGRYRRSSDLRTALTYFRLSGRLADLIYSLNTTNTDFYSYQFKPVLNFLDSPAQGLLIADEVGLGKTIEAGLIWTELRSRDDSRRLLVLCPAMLRVKWQRELVTKFGIEARICSAAETLGHLEEEAAGRRRGFAIIASLQGLRPPTGWQEGDEDDSSGATRLAQFLLARGDEEPLVDLTVIDEAHYLRNPETQTARLGRLLRPVSAHLLLLSATPIQLRSSDLFHLLNLLDEDTFRYEWSFETILQENAPLVTLRDRILKEPVSSDDFVEAVRAAQIARSLGESAVLQHLINSPPSDEELADRGTRIALAEQLDRVNPLSRVVSRTRKRDVEERRVRRQPYAIRAQLSAIEEEFYADVTSRVRDYCARFDIAEGFLLTIPQRQLCSSMPAACRAWKRRLEEAEVQETLQETLADPEALNGEDERPAAPTVGPLVQELAQIAARIGDYDALRKADSKFALLRGSLEDYWHRYPDAKVVLFSYFRETLHYLAERFEEIGWRCIVLMGGMDKDAVLDEFGRPAGPRLLLSSEVASEGVDLQFSSLVINYDLPWNPMRVEQRIGRIDRIGQSAERILIWNLFYENTLDDRVYTRLFERLNIFEQALGSTEAILGEPIRQMTYDLLRHNLSAEEEIQRIEQARLAMERKSRDENELETQVARLIAHGAYLQTKIAQARDLNRYVTSEDLFAYVRDFVLQRYPGSQLVRRDGPDFLADVELTATARADLAHYAEVERMQGQTRLATPASGRVLCQFENRLQRPRPDREFVSQYHPLVRLVTASLKRSESEHVAALTATILGRDEVPQIGPGTYIFAVRRWSFSGGREVERLAYAAGSLGESPLLSAEDAERLITTAAWRGQDWPEAAHDAAGPAARERLTDCFESLDERYDEFVAGMKRESDDRLDLQLHVLLRHEENKRRDLSERIASLRLQGKMKAVRMFDAQMRKLADLTADRRAFLEKKRSTTDSSRLVGAGAICVQ